ncbi:hypothetical protein COV05_04540, partial [Candidatus Uhrbacteria bacterium CG10_big_fil_rev_8_21_14_0_10_48_16]
MRNILILVALALTGCATVHKSLEDGTTVTYNGHARGAATVLDASNERPYDLAETAMDNGMATSLQTRDTRFTAGYGVQGYGSTSVGGYAPGTVTYMPGQGVVRTGAMETLPTLATTTVVTGIPPGQRQQSLSLTTTGCPEGREPIGTDEIAQCAYELGQAA